MSLWLCDQVCWISLQKAQAFLRLRRKISFEPSSFLILLFVYQLHEFEIHRVRSRRLTKRRPDSAEYANIAFEFLDCVV